MTAGARDPNVRRLWQRSFYNHILRDGENENVVEGYIFANQVRKGLVEDAREWVYSSLWAFDRKMFMTPLDQFVPPWKVTLMAG